MLSLLAARSFGSSRVRLPHAAPGQRIGLLGGSFNPPHQAHLAISEAVLDRLGLDQLWWLVSPGNPLKDHHDLSPLGERLAACRAFVRDPRIKITALEADLGSAATVVTLAFLKQRCRAVHFVWVMGGDNLAGFHRWTQWRGIAALMPFVVADRPLWRFRALSAPAARALAHRRLPEHEVRALALRPPPAWAYLSVRLSGFSSTEIRARRRLVPSAS